MSKIKCRVFKAQKRQSQSGKNYIQQVVEILQEDFPNEQILRFPKSEETVLEDGLYEASVRFYTRRLFENNKTVTQLCASLNNLKKIEA